MTSLAEPEPRGWMLPLFAVTFLDNTFVPFSSFSPDQTSATGTQYKGSSCPVDDVVTVVDPAYHRQTLKVIVTGGRFWQSTGNNEPWELQPPHQPQPLKYIDLNGSCHEHWVISGGSRQAAGIPDIDPEEPDNSTLIPWLDDKPTFSVPFNITRPENNDSDLDAIGSPLASLIPDLYPIRIQLPDTGKPALPQAAIWLHHEPEQALLLIPSEFPALIPIPATARDNSDLLICAVFLSINSGKVKLYSHSFTEESTYHQQQNDDPLLRLLALIYGAVFCVKDNNDETFYIIRMDNGQLLRISASSVRRWFSIFSQAFLESLYPEIFGPILPAGGGWHQWNHYVRKVSGNNEKRGKAKGRGRGSMVGQPVQKPRRPDRVGQGQATGLSSPVQKQRQQKHRVTAEKKAENDRNTADQRVASPRSHTGLEIVRQLHKAEELYKNKAYDQCIGVLLRVHLRMDSVGTSNDHENRAWLINTLNKAIYQQMRTQVLAASERGEHEQALLHLRPLKLIPVELLPEQHIKSMEDVAHDSGLRTYRPAIEDLHTRQKGAKDQVLIRQSAINIYFEYRLVMPCGHHKNLANVWCYTLKPLLDAVGDALSQNDPKTAFNQIGPDVIKFMDMLSAETRASHGTLSRVRGMLENIISRTLTDLEQKPESSSQLDEFQMEWMLLIAHNRYLVDRKKLETLRERLTALQQSRASSVQEHYSIRFMPLYEQGQSRPEEVSLHKKSILELLRQVDRYLEHGMFGKAMGLIITIHKVTKGALSFPTKVRLYRQLRSAAYPLLYDLTVEISLHGRNEGSQKTFLELWKNLGELELELAEPQRYAMLWMKKVFPAPKPDAPAAPAPPWLEAIEKALSTASYRELLTILREASVTPNSKALEQSVRSRLREVVHQAIATLSDLIQQELTNTHNTTVEEQLTLLGELVAYIGASPEVSVASLLEQRQALLDSQSLLDSITALIDQREWLQSVDLMNTGNAVPDAHVEQLHSAAQQLVSSILEASQLAEGQNELHQALTLLETASSLEFPISDDSKGQMQNLRQRLQHSQTVQQVFAEVSTSRSDSTTAAVQLLLQQQAVEQTAVSPATWQMVTEEVTTTAQSLISLLEQNLNQVELEKAGALLAQLQQLQALYPDALKSLQTTIEALSTRHTELVARLTEMMNEDLEWVSKVPTMRTKMEFMKRLIYLYPQALLTTRAVLIDGLLQKTIQQMRLRILLNSSDTGRWHLAIESLSTLNQLLTTHPALVLPDSSAEFQKVEGTAWLNIKDIFRISSFPTSILFVRKHERVLHRNPGSALYLARLLEKAGYLGAAHRLYRTLGENTDDPETKKTCHKEVVRIKEKAESIQDGNRNSGGI
ncbi:MAG: hypothetical protein ACR2PT_02980 [Endozoicomonas sp.]